MTGKITHDLSCGLAEGRILPPPIFSLGLYLLFIEYGLQFICYCILMPDKG